tara:strand:+ start:267 stop:551 length:285 start_codon:yes stop_codon:yes gene_type:complete
VRDKIKLNAVSASDLGLPGRTKLAIDGKGAHYIIKNIKSRIIMKDGKKILEAANKIKTEIKTTVFFATTAPICSKTKAYLKENNIETVFDYIVS